MTDISSSPGDWLGPATIDTVHELGRAGVKRLDVFCPGFPADCLETLEEINILNREAYSSASREKGTFNFIPCLNDDPDFIGALSEVVRDGLRGWVG